MQVSRRDSSRADPFVLLVPLLVLVVLAEPRTGVEEMGLARDRKPGSALLPIHPYSVHLGAEPTATASSANCTERIDIQAIPTVNLVIKTRLSHPRWGRAPAGLPELTTGPPGRAGWISWRGVVCCSLAPSSPPRRFVSHVLARARSLGALWCMRLEASLNVAIELPLRYSTASGLANRRYFL